MTPPARSCVLCGKCLDVCPLFAATSREQLSPRAKHLLAASADGVVDAASARRLAGMCLGCGRCRGACPFKLSAADTVSRLKASSPGFEGWLWGRWVAGAGALWPVMATVAGLLPSYRSGALGEALAGLQAMGVGPEFAPWLRPVRFNACGNGRKAVVFAGCAARHVSQEWSAKAAALLTGLGFEVSSDPGFACCGKTLAGAGLLEARGEMMRRNVAAWRATGRPLIAVFCATCLEALRGYAGEELGWEPGEARLWSEGIEPLARLALRVEFAEAGRVPGRIIHHAPCHGADGELELLRAALGGRVEGTGRGPCCGFGGALKLSAPGLSAQVARQCLDFYGPRPGDRILTGCSGCVFQLRSHAPEGVLAGHWLDAVDTASQPGPG